MSEKLFTTIKTNQGNVKIPQDDRELQKVVSLIYSMDQEIDQLKAQIEKMKNCYNCKYVDRQYGSCNLISDLVGLGSKCSKWEMMR